MINPTLTELVSIPHDIIVDIILQYGLNQPDILIVSDPATIIDLGSKEIDDFVRHVIVFIQQHFQLSFTYCQVFVGELVSDVPSDGSEFTTVLDDGVEEGEAEEQFLIL